MNSATSFNKCYGLRRHDKSFICKSRLDLKELKDQQLAMVLEAVHADCMLDKIDSQAVAEMVKMKSS